MKIAGFLLERLKEAFGSANMDGIPVPTLRDPQTGKGSVTFTMVAVSFGTAILLLLGKVTHFVGEVDYNNVLWLLGITLSAYLGRKFQGDGKKISIDDKIIEAPPQEKK